MTDWPRNPLVRASGVYPFQRLTEARRMLGDALPGRPLVDLGAGEPREETPAFIRRALVAAIEAETVSSYPLAVGLPELRESIARWCATRFGVRLDPDRHVLPTLGSKELVFSLAQLLVDRDAGRDLVAAPRPGYPVYERGARHAGAEVLPLPLLAANGFLPDLDAITPEQWSRLVLLWTNYPNNPTAAVADRGWYRDAVARCREHGVVLASDEAYSELWFDGEPPTSALEVALDGHAPDGGGNVDADGDRSDGDPDDPGADGTDDGGRLEGVLVVNTLSKRSSMPGYRSGFVAGDAALIADLKRFRPSVGTAPQRFVQHAAVAAWADEDHVVAVRARYREKLATLQPGLDALGLDSVGGAASFFRWLRVPDGWSERVATSGDPERESQVRALLADAPVRSTQDDGAHRGLARNGAMREDGGQDDVALAARLLVGAGIVVAPGSFFGPEGAGHVRVALVPTAEDCAVAAKRLLALTA
ncbi:MAG: pyridoxal phosphate-dependent aminotransferase [Solirubrobacteraceae bacterium]